MPQEISRPHFSGKFPAAFSEKKKNKQIFPEFTIHRKITQFSKRIFQNPLDK
jgi:hypothetical protein